MQCDVQPAAPREFRRAEGAVEAPVTGTCRRGRSDTSIGSGWRPLVLLDTFGHFWTLSGPNAARRTSRRRGALQRFSCRGRSSTTGSGREFKRRSVAGEADANTSIAIAWSMTA